MEPPILAQGLPEVRMRLRDGTRSEHHSLDQSMSLLDLADAADYGKFLRMQLTALDELASSWADADTEDFAALRYHLAQDLQLLSPSASRSAVAPRTAHVHALSRAAQWGVAYVIRGSRLGSKLLSARVAPGFAKSYFDYLPGITWPHFLTDLAHAAQTFDDVADRQVLEGAKFAFAVYANAAPNRGCSGI